MQRPDAILEVTISLWKRLAFELVSIIGEGGFQSLYSRSTHLTSLTYPWVALSQVIRPTDTGFSDLQIFFKGQDSTQASDASIALLVTFIDILIDLIGEHLTTSILRSAWGSDAVDIAVKELR